MVEKRMIYSSLFDKMVPHRLQIEEGSVIRDRFNPKLGRGRRGDRRCFHNRSIKYAMPVHSCRRETTTPRYRHALRRAGTRGESAGTRWCFHTSLGPGNSNWARPRLQAFRAKPWRG